MGDFNIDLIKASSDNSISEYLNTIASNNFLPLYLYQQELPITQKFLKTKNLHDEPILEKTYKTYKNLLVTLIRRSKKNHFSNYFTTNSNSLRATWKGIRALLKIRSNDISSTPCISSKNTIINDPVKISEIFNSFFILIHEELQKNIHSSHTDFHKYLKTSNPDSLFIKPTEKNEIISVIFSLNDGKASGPNSIPTFVLKLLADDISLVLSNLFNISFATGIFPNILKTASVKPIHKKDSKLDCNNYRPISLLSNVSKILEKLMYSRIYHFIENFKCLYGRQFGFHLKHSTSHALISITEMIRGAIDSGSFACGVFIDLQKAFDTVDIKILTEKFYLHGIRSIANDWFSSYINNLTQFVSINGFQFRCKVIKYGVPQGSVPGTLLLSIYINDLPHSINNSIVHHFANDTNLLCINKSLAQLCKKVNSDLRHLCHWLNSNRLFLNINITKFIIFHPPQKKIDSNNVKIRINEWIVPLKSKTGVDVADALNKIFKERKCLEIWVDKEFYNKHVKALGVELYSTENEEKSCVVQHKMVNKYNNTRHSSIKMTPVEVSDKKNNVWLNLNENVRFILIYGMPIWKFFVYPITHLVRCGCILQCVTVYFKKNKCSKRLHANVVCELINLQWKNAITNIQVKATSNHDPQILNGIFKGFVHRAFNVCSQKHMENELKFLIQVFVENGYKQSNLIKIIKEIKRKNKKSLVTTKNNENITSTYPTISLPWVPIMSPKLRKVFRKAGYKRSLNQT
ncbi:uncharacterized protein LOC136087869 [Hydra vulgaris]|uniref:Uncharacterized protein LOC136087869 n=1 Tax=Hydra vulgaris TaxID=6087 RepID=A0ABM4D017_HYDVU